MMKEQDDIEIIRSILQGNKSAYSILVSRYSNYVFTIVMRYINNRELAEELAQDVFVKAYRFLADFKGNSKFSTWLYAIVNTTCLSHLRKKKDGSILMEEEKLVFYAGNTNSASYNLEQKTQKEIINTAMNLLPEADSLILNLFYIAEQSIEEIGVIVGLTPTNVKVKLFRARQKLKEIVENKYSKELAYNN